ncbi:hypothetical protein EJ110_NYTH33205 [Nymphaea thermarum]|nr:hypothetical protein EJ110_NYTH33205 [Nymphaea thermarum]
MIGVRVDTLECKGISLKLYPDCVVLPFVLLTLSKFDLHCRNWPREAEIGRLGLRPCFVLPRPRKGRAWPPGKDFLMNQSVSLFLVLFNFLDISLKGIFKGKCGTNLNYAVAIVGYGTENDIDYLDSKKLIGR